MALPPTISSGQDAGLELNSLHTVNSSTKNERTTTPGEVQNDETVDLRIQEGKNEFVTGITLALVVFGVTCVVFVLFLDGTIIVTAIPKITNEFNSVQDIGWYGSAFLLTNCSLQPLTGKLYKHYTSKWIFLSALAIFELGSLVCALANSSTMFILGRAVAGIGGSGLMNGALTILSASAPINKRPMLIGVCVGFGSVGSVLGPVIGGALTEKASWRWCFWINLPLGAITSIILVLIKVPDAKIPYPDGTTTRQKIKNLDLPGCTLFAPAIIMLLLALQWGGSKYVWGSATIIGLFVGSAVTMVVFLFWERQTGDSQAMLPLGLLKNKIVVCAALVSLLSFGSFMLVTYFLPVWFQAARGVSPLTSGVDYTPTVGANIVAAVVAGAIIQKIGYFTPFALIGNIIAAIGTGLMSTLVPTSSPAAWICYQFLNGASRGFLMQQPILAMQVALPKEEVSQGTALLTLCSFLGGSVILTCGQTLFSTGLVSAMREFAPGVNVEDVIAAGATNFRDHVPAAAVDGVIMAYNQALTHTFYIAAAVSSVAFFLTFGMGWGNVNAKKAETTDDAKSTV